MDRLTDIKGIIERFGKIEQSRSTTGKRSECVECGRVFYRNNPNQIYCSEQCANRHRQREYRRRHSRDK